MRALGKIPVKKIIFIFFILFASTILGSWGLPHPEFKDKWLVEEKIVNEVVIGKVQKTTSLWVNTTSSSLIYTIAEIKVSEYVKTTKEKNDIIKIIYPGGRIGQELHIVISDPYGYIACHEGQKVKIYGNIDKNDKVLINVNVIQVLEDAVTSQYSIQTYTLPSFINENMKLGFVFTRGCWDTAAFPIEYWVNPNCADVTNEQFEVRDGIATWENDPLSVIDFTYKGTTIIDYAANYDANACFWNTWVSTVLAQCYIYCSGYQCYAFDIRFNDYHTYGIDDSTKYDVQSVTTHEAGHILALENLNNNGVWEPFNTYTMWTPSPLGTSQSTLEKGDKDGAQYIYPLYSKPIVDVLSPSELAQLRKGQQFTISATASGGTISEVQFKFTDRGFFPVDSGWSSMSYIGGSYQANYTPSTLYPTGWYWVIVRAKNTNGMYGYHIHSVYLNP